MKMIVALLLVALASMISASVLQAGGVSLVSYSLPSTGFCYEAKVQSGFGTVTIESPESTRSWSQFLEKGIDIAHYQPRFDGPLTDWIFSRRTMNVTVRNMADELLHYTTYTSHVNPCDPNPCNVQQICVHQPQCTFKCDPSLPLKK